jgi:hypothetical protein
MAAHDRRLAQWVSLVKGTLTIFSYVWDWVDERDVDKHFIATVTMYFMVYLIQWAEHYAALNVARPGWEVAAVIAAVNAPYMAMQAVVLKFYFDYRTPVSYGGSRPNVIP